MCKGLMKTMCNVQVDFLSVLKIMKYDKSLIRKLL